MAHEPRPVFGEVREVRKRRRCAKPRHESIRTAHFLHVLREKTPGARFASAICQGAGFGLAVATALAFTPANACAACTNSVASLVVSGLTSARGACLSAALKRLTI